MIPLFYGEEAGGGLRTNNRALSLEMSAVTPGDCPTGQRHFRKKPRYKMTVENSMKPCDGAMKQCDMGQNIPMPNGRNAISNMGQQAMGNFTTQIT